MNRREMITFTFSNRDIEVCRCLVLAAHSAGVLQELFSDAEIEGKIGADELRQLKPFIDLYLVVSTNNTEAVERITGMNGSAFIDAIKRGRILVIDDLDSGFHSELTRRIISIFDSNLNQAG